jgi:hypothetical protein
MQTDHDAKAVVVALAGRRIDAPGSDPPRFPLDNVPTVRTRLARLMSAEHVTALICSTACGADRVALEEAGCPRAASAHCPALRAGAPPGYLGGGPASGVGTGVRPPRRGSSGGRPTLSCSTPARATRPTPPRTRPSRARRGRSPGPAGPRTAWGSRWSGRSGEGRDRRHRGLPDPGREGRFRGALRAGVLSGAAPPRWRERAPCGARAGRASCPGRGL